MYQSMDELPTIIFIPDITARTPVEGENIFFKDQNYIIDKIVYNTASREYVCYSHKKEINKKCDMTQLEFDFNKK